MSGMEAPSPSPGHLDFRQEADVKSCYGQYEYLTSIKEKTQGRGGGEGEV